MKSAGAYAEPASGERRASLVQHFIGPSGFAQLHSWVGPRVVERCHPVEVMDAWPEAGHEPGREGGDRGRAPGLVASGRPANPAVLRFRENEPAF